MNGLRSRSSIVLLFAVAIGMASCDKHEDHAAAQLPPNVVPSGYWSQKLSESEIATFERDGLKAPRALLEFDATGGTFTIERYLPKRRETSQRYAGGEVTGAGPERPDHVEKGSVTTNGNEVTLLTDTVDGTQTPGEGEKKPVVFEMSADERTLTQKGGTVTFVKH
jgi:hypothetical protein